MREDNLQSHGQTSGRAGENQALSPDNHSKPQDVSESFTEQKAVISVKNYLIFYYLHVVYYSTLGPVWYLVLFWLRPVRSSLMNLLFIRLNPWCFFQNFYWSTCAIVFIFALILNNTGHVYTTLDAALLYSTLINTFFRSATISGKYCTYPQGEIDKIFDGVIQASTVRKEMMLDSWRGQSDEVIEKEIKAVDNYEKIDAQYVWLAKKGQMNSEKVVILFAQKFRETGGIPLVVTILIFLYAGVRAVGHGLLNLAVGIRFHGNTTEEAVLFYYIALWQFMYYSVGPSFFLLLYQDLKRQLYMTDKAIQILSSTLVPELEHDTFVQNDPQQKKGVFGVVRLLDKYGDRFMQRHKALLAFIILHALFLILAMFPFYFRIFQYSQFVSSERKLQTLMAFDLLFLVIASLMGLCMVALLNSKKSRMIDLIQMSTGDDFKVDVLNFTRDSKLRILTIEVGFLHLLVVALVAVAGLVGAILVVFIGKYKIV